MSSEVQFDDDQLKYAHRPVAGGGNSGGGFAGGGYVPGEGGNQPRMVRWLMKKGIVKSPAMAQGFLIGLVIINIIITYVVITFFL